jgi:hypothetical protein
MQDETRDGAVTLHRLLPYPRLHHHECKQAQRQKCRSHREPPGPDSEKESSMHNRCGQPLSTGGKQQKARPKVAGLQRRGNQVLLRSRRKLLIALRRLGNCLSAGLLRGSLLNKALLATILELRLGDFAVAIDIDQVEVHDEGCGIAFR